MVAADSEAPRSHHVFQDIRRYKFVEFRDSNYGMSESNRPFLAGSDCDAHQMLTHIFLCAVYT